MEKLVLEYPVEVTEVGSVIMADTIPFEYESKEKAENDLWNLVVKRNDMRGYYKSINWLGLNINNFILVNDGEKQYTIFTIEEWFNERKVPHK